MANLTKHELEVLKTAAYKRYGLKWQPMSCDILAEHGYISWLLTISIKQVKGPAKIVTLQAQSNMSGDIGDTVDLYAIQFTHPEEAQDFLLIASQSLNNILKINNMLFKSKNSVIG